MTTLVKIEEQGKKTLNVLKAYIKKSDNAKKNKDIRCFYENISSMKEFIFGNEMYEYLNRY